MTYRSVKGVPQAVALSKHHDPDAKIWTAPLVQEKLQLHTISAMFLHAFLYFMDVPESMLLVQNLSEGRKLQQEVVPAHPHLAARDTQQHCWHKAANSILPKARSYMKTLLVHSLQDKL